MGFSRPFPLVTAFSGPTSQGASALPPGSFASEARLADLVQITMKALWHDQFQRHGSLVAVIARSASIRRPWPKHNHVLSSKWSWAGAAFDACSELWWVADPAIRIPGASVRIPISLGFDTIALARDTQVPFMQPADDVHPPDI